MKKALLTALAVATLGAATPALAETECTRIVGYSQTRQWFNRGFESVVDGGSYELFWRSGGSLEGWASGANWSAGTLQSACTTGPPTRVVLDVAVGTEDGTSPLIPGQLLSAVNQARSRFPGAVVGVQPIVGGPGYAICPYQTGTVDASVQAPNLAVRIDAAVANDPALFRGPNPQVPDCSMYRDERGHLTGIGSRTMSQIIGGWYAAA